MDTPVLFCIFNRPKTTQRVFQRLAEVQPRNLYVAADGPRSEVSTDTMLVQETRDVIAKIDWDCNLRTCFSDANQGCRRAMNNAIDWVFRYHDQAIILEDDCLPEPEFFDFCTELLDQYRDHQHVMMISGDNFQNQSRTEHSYYFSKYAHIWGWATWRRAWRNQHDPEMKSWAKIRDTNWMSKLCPLEDEARFWQAQFQKQWQSEFDTWDFAWQYSIWQANSLVALPDRNLVSNIGFGDSATHTTDTKSKLSCLPTFPLGKLSHPVSVVQNVEADLFTWRNIFTSLDETERTKSPSKSKKFRSMWSKLNQAWKAAEEAA